MAKPEEIIEEIRRKEFLIGVEMSPEVEEGARNMRRNLNNALRTLSEDLYSKDTHFVLELVQNADDNEYLQGVEPEISFQLSPSRLIVQNNERGFLSSNVEALCRVGQSTKARRAGFIGEKGIGFKSVFTVTDRPEIHSNGFHFHFDRTNPTYVLGYVVPHWCASQEYPEELTTIVLPAKPGTEFTGDKLDELTDELLLFLRKLRTITVSDELSGNKRVYRRRDDAGTVKLTAEPFVPATGKATESSERKFKYVLHTYSTAAIKEDKRQDVTESNVVLAFPVTDNGTAMATSTHNVFAFLPVRNYGLRFLVQADFLLSSNREDIHKNAVWNKRARDEVVRAFLNAVSIFKTDPALATTFLQFVPRKGDVADPFFSEAADKIVEGLKKSDCILSASGAWRKPSEVITADAEFRSLFPNNELRAILGIEYVSDSVQAPQATLDRLEVASANLQRHLFEIVQKDPHFSERPVEWFKAFYVYCEKRITSGADVIKFKRLRAIKLDGGNLASSSETKAYFPLKRGRRYGFEHELPFVDAALFDGGDADKVVTFLTRVGVKNSEPYSLILEHILPKHAAEDWKQSQIKALVGHVRYIKEHLPHFLKGAAAAGKTEDQILSHLGTAVYLHTKKVENETTYFARPNSMYLGSEYRPTNGLERLLGEAADPNKFVSDIYLGEESKEQDEGETERRREWREFFYRIGVNQYPAVEVISYPGNDYTANPELQALLTSEDVKIRRKAIEIVEHNWAYYSQFLQVQVPGRRGHVYTIDSKFLQFLQDINAPSKRRGTFKFAETYLDVEHIRAVFGESVVYLDAEVSNHEFLNALNVTHQVDAAACIKRLDQLRASPRANVKHVKIIYRELEHLFAKEKTSISNAFAQDPRIYVPSVLRWFTIDEVVWESNSAFIDGLHPPLESVYREHRTFFCRYLNISTRPKESTLIQALTRLSEYGESHDVRKAEAFRIYKRLARSFRDHAVSNSAEPDWIETMRTEPVFLDHLDRLVHVSNDIYIADDARMAEAFKAHEQISLLAVNAWETPQLLELLEVCGMPRLSEAAQYRLLSLEGSHLEVEMTRRIKHRIPYLMRLFYARAHPTFDSASRQGLWKSLQSIEIRSVQKLEVGAELSGHTVQVPTETYRDGNIIYIQADTRGKTDRVAQELCLYLGAKPDSISESVYRVLTATEDNEVQDFFEVKSVPAIASAELIKLLGEHEQSDRSPDLSSDQEEDIPETPEERASAQPGEASEPQSHFDESAAPGDQDTGLWEPPGGGIVGQPTKAHERDTSKNEQAMSASASAGSSSRQPSEPFTEASTTLPSAITTHAPGETSQSDRRRKESERKPSGRLLSYAEPASQSDQDSADSGSHEERLTIAKAAVDFVLQLERENGHEVVEMPFTNEGFDIKRGAEGSEEYIEVKGLRGVWSVQGIVLTPPELRMAERQRERYWLYVVEFATDPEHRQLYRVQDPFGKTTQFRFDSGWKGLVSGTRAQILEPAEGRRISIEGLGNGTILSVSRAGVLRRLTIRLDSGAEMTRTYDPTRMSISEPV